MTSIDLAAQTGMTRRPLVAKERAMWLFREYAPDDGVLNVAFALVPVAAPVDVAVLRTAVAAVVARHSALRTLFPVSDGEPTRLTLAAAEVDTGPVVTEREVDEAGLDSALRDATTVRIELATDLPLQVTVFRTPEREVVVVAVDHLVYDAHSAQVVERDLTLAYAALVVDGVVPAALHDEVTGPPIVDGSDTSTAYWRDALDGAMPSGDLDVGRHAPRAVGFPGETVRLHVDDDAWPAAEAAARAANTPVSAVALAAFATVLARHGAGTDLVVGVPTYNRGRPAHDAVGYYMSVAPVRVSFELTTGFATLARKCAERMLEGLQYADASIDEVQANVYESAGDADRPLVRYLFNYLADLRDDPETGSGSAAAGRSWRGHRLQAVHSRMDLDLAFWRDPEGVMLRATYASDLFSGEQVVVLLARMQQVLRAGAADPTMPISELPIATSADVALAAAAEVGVAGVMPRDVLEDIATSAFVGADTSAMLGAAGVDRLTYGSLAASVAAVAGALGGAGVTPGSTVAVAPASLADTCIAVLGAWVAGCTVALDDPPGTEVARRLVAADRTPGADETAVERVSGDGFVVFERSHPDDVALVATGPAGPVSLTHTVVTDTVDDLALALALGPADVVALARQGSRIETVLDALAVLRSGGSVGADAAVGDTASVLFTGPLPAARLADGVTTRGTLTRVAVRGGRVPTGLASRASDAGLALVRVTGPHLGAGVSTVGRLDGDTAPMHLTVAGGVRVNGPDGGASLPFTRGTLAVHGVTAPAGLVVQLTGRGVEQVDDDRFAPVLGELLAHPLVRYAAVLVDGDVVRVAVEARIEQPDPVGLAGLVQFGELVERQYGVRVVVADALLPVGPDTEPVLVEQIPAEPKPAEAVAVSNTADAGPAIDGVDIAALWGEVLGRDGIGPDDNFFALGGDSLMAARVIGQLKKRTGRKIPLRTAFKFPTPAGFAAAVHS